MAEKGLRQIPSGFKNGMTCTVELCSTYRSEHPVLQRCSVQVRRLPGGPSLCSVSPASLVADPRTLQGCVQATLVCAVLECGVHGLQYVVYCDGMGFRALLFAGSGVPGFVASVGKASDVYLLDPHRQALLSPLLAIEPLMLRRRQLRRSTWRNANLNM